MAKKKVPLTREKALTLPKEVPLFLKTDGLCAKVTLIDVRKDGCGLKITEVLEPRDSGFYPGEPVYGKFSDLEIEVEEPSA